MSKFPFYKQLDIMDCGPTCLRMVAKYYGKSYSLQSLREKSKINREGVSLKGISEAAEAISLQTMGTKLSFAQLANEVPLPCIVHWEQNHFVIVYEITNRTRFAWKNLIGEPPSREYTVHVADPAHGLINYTETEFIKSWNPDSRSTGIALLLEPLPQFYAEQDEAEESVNLVRLFSFVFSRKYHRLLVQLMIGLIVGSLLQLALPFLTQAIVDEGIIANNLSFIYLILIAQIMLVIGRVSVDFIRSWILLHISSRISITILSEFLSKLMRLPLVFFDVKLFGDLMQRFEDQRRIESFLTNSSLATLLSLFNMVIFGAVLAYYNFSIFLVFLIGIILYGLWIALFLNKRRLLDYKRFEVYSQDQSALVQLIQGMQEIKLANSEIDQRWGWERIQARIFKLNVRILSLNQYQQVGAFFINEGKNILITFFTARAVIRGEITLGAMLAVQYIIGQLNSPVEQLVNFIQSAQSAQISLERLNEIHGLPDEEPAAMPHVQTIPLNSGFHLHKVDFHYPGQEGQYVLQDLSLSIPPGQVTAIVGASGSGKTTLLKLLLKFYSPVHGSIYIGDVRLEDLSHKPWRSQCGVVMQEGFIFSDTIARNIAVGESDIELERLRYAVKIANIQSYVEALPLGYNTKIGMDGNGMSQGQRQRILIARAVYKNPAYLFFDEATNALDAENESTILHNLEHFFQDRTVVVVAHRLSTVRKANQIVVLNKGNIVEIGTHEKLIQLQGYYHRLVKNQLELGS